MREDLPVDSPITPGFDIPYVPLAQNQSAPTVEGSRLASANIAPPLIDPGRAAIAFGPMDILAQPRSAAQGGIMSTNKAFQRVA